MTKIAGIFAAGEGSRLQKAYPGVIKPMIPINGIPLIEWTTSLMVKAGFTDITVLLNSRGLSAREHLASKFKNTAKLNFIVRNTASSWESFRLLSGELSKRAESFVLSTVDSLYDPALLAGLASAYPENSFDAVLGVTDHIADEKYF